MHIDQMPYVAGGDTWAGHNADFRNDRMGVMQRLAVSTDPIMRLRLPVPGAKALVVNEPDLVQEMLVQHGRIFDKSGMLRFSLYPLAGEGLFTSNGELWRRQRRLMAPLFTPRALDRYADDMIRIAERTVDAWHDGGELDLHHETTRLTMSVAGKTLFDADTFSEADTIGQALTVALDWTGWMLGRPYAIAHVVTRRLLQTLRAKVPDVARGPIDKSIERLHGPVALLGERGRELAEAIALLDDYVQKLIDTRRADRSKHDDLLTHLLEAHDEDDGSRMSDRQVRDEVLTLFVAGHETTATGLAWSIYLAARHPEVYEAMEREVDALGRQPTAEDLPRLDYCLRVFREALRLYPPVYMFGRDSTEDVTLGEFEIPRGTNALVCPWSLHRLPQHWPEPERFDPDRFLPEAEAERHRYAYLPFGAGPRVCLGKDFAYMEAQLALAVILRRYRFEVLGDAEPEPSATLRPKGGIRVRVRAR